MKSLKIAVFCSVVFLFPAAHVAQAQTIGYGEAIAQLTAACGADIEKFCKGVKPGGGRIDACLAKNSGVSAGCRQTYAAALASLQKRAQAQEAVQQVCRADAARLCSNFREGQARILRCLIRSENVRRVTNRCNQAITDAGWR